MIVRVFKKYKEHYYIFTKKKKTQIDQEKYNFNFIHRILINNYIINKTMNVVV